jgi:hypothetical protein
MLCDRKPWPKWPVFILAALLMGPLAVFAQDAATTPAPAAGAPANQTASTTTGGSK